jgi:LuxR family maltose regulon positive regulatory protein
MKAIPFIDKGNSFLLGNRSWAFPEHQHAGFERIYATIDNLKDCQMLWLFGPPYCGKRSFITKYSLSRNICLVCYKAIRTVDSNGSYNYRLAGSSSKTSQDGSHTEKDNNWPISILNDKSRLMDFLGAIRKNASDALIVAVENIQYVFQTGYDFNAISAVIEQVNKKDLFVWLSDVAPAQSVIELCCKKKAVIVSWYAMKTTTKDIATDKSTGLRRVPHLEEYFPVMTTNYHDVMRSIVIAQEGSGVLDTIDNSTYDASMEYKICARIFNQLPTGVQLFFTKTALFPRLNKRMVNELTDDPEAEFLLEKIAAVNTADGIANAQEKIYRYHPMLKRFLRQYALKEYGPSHFSRELFKVVNILLRYNMVEDACTLLPDVEDSTIKAEYICNHACELMHQDKIGLIEQVMKSLPMNMYMENASLGVWYGLINVYKNPANVKNIVDEIYKRLKDSDDREGMRLAWICSVDSLILSAENQATLGNWINEPIVEMTLKGTAELQPWVEARFLSALFMARMLINPDHKDIFNLYEQLNRRKNDIFSPADKVEILNRILYFLINYSDYVDIEHSIQELEKNLDCEYLPPVLRARSECVRAIYLRNSGQFEAARSALKNARTVAELHELRGLREEILSMQVASYVTCNDLPTAKSMLNSMMNENTSMTPYGSYHFCRAVMACATADQEYAKARKYGESASMAAKETGIPLHGIIHTLDVAYLNILLKNFSQAEKQLASIGNACRESGGTILRMTLECCETFLCLSTKRENAAMEKLSALLFECKIRNLFGIYMGPPIAAEKVCLLALEAKQQGNFVTELIQIRNIKPASAPVHLDIWPWPVKVYTLGRFAILNKNKKIKFNKKTKKKPLELLKALIAMGGRGVREEQIIDALWPDAEADFGHRTFSTTLHRLRKIIGNHKAIALKGGCLTMDPNHIWVDAWAFERNVGSASRSLIPGLKFGEHQYAVHKALMAIEYYRGPFLGSEAWEIWAVNYSERLRNKYLRIVGKLGHFWESNNHLEEAVECFLKSLEVDNTDEVAYRRLMACYFRMGKRSKALSTYRRCKEILYENLGIPPSLDTENLKRSLMGDHD